MIMFNKIIKIQPKTYLNQFLSSFRYKFITQTVYYYVPTYIKYYKNIFLDKKQKLNIVYNNMIDDGN